MDLHEFWWKAIKSSHNKSWEGFGTAAIICTAAGGIVAVLLILHTITKEWGDYMIYWSLAVPVLIWWILFLWHFIKAPHRIFNEQMVQSQQIKEPKNWLRFALLFAVFSIFIVIIAVQGHKIKQLTNRMAHSQNQAELPNNLSILEKDKKASNAFRNATYYQDRKHDMMTASKRFAESYTIYFELSLMQQSYWKNVGDSARGFAGNRPNSKEADLADIINDQINHNIKMPSPEATEFYEIAKKESSQPTE